MDGTRFSEGDATKSIIQVKPVSEVTGMARDAIKLEMAHLLALAKNESQRLHMMSCLNLDFHISLAIGSAGGGRTFISVLCALFLLKMQIIDKIIISRPAVTAGEDLGFLPGDVDEKLGPFSVPIYDAFGLLNSSKLLGTEYVQVVSVAHMRGRTFHNAAIILDECQNTTPMQMRMILGRIGVGSYLFANGDLNQCDLPERRQPDGTWVQMRSGLKYHFEGLMKALQIEDISSCKIYRQGVQELLMYDPRHVVRSEAAAGIVDFYKTYCD